MQIVRFGEHRAVLEHAIEAGMVAISKARQIVIAKLIDRDRQNQLGFGSRSAGERCSRDEIEKNRG